MHTGATGQTWTPTAAARTKPLHTDRALYQRSNKGTRIWGFSAILLCRSSQTLVRLDGDKHFSGLSRDVRLGHSCCIPQSDGWYWPGDEWCLVFTDINAQNWGQIVQSWSPLESLRCFLCKLSLRRGVRLATLPKAQIGGVLQWSNLHTVTIILSILRHIFASTQSCLWAPPAPSAETFWILMSKWYLSFSFWIHLHKFLKFGFRFVF